MKNQRELLKQKLGCELLCCSINDKPVSEAFIDHIINICYGSFEIQHNKKRLNVRMLLRAFRGLPPDAKPTGKNPDFCNIPVMEYLDSVRLQDPCSLRAEAQTFHSQVLTVQSVPYIVNNHRAYEWEIDWRS
jgi:hypothetical protein